VFTLPVSPSDSCDLSSFLEEHRLGLNEYEQPDPEGLETTGSAKQTDAECPLFFLLVAVGFSGSLCE